MTDNPFSPFRREYIEELSKLYNEGAVKIASTILRAAMFMNGSGALALIAFLATAHTKGNPSLVLAVNEGLTNSLFLMFSGLALTIAAATFGYLSLFITAERLTKAIKDEKIYENTLVRPYKPLLILSFILMISSYGFFICGIRLTYYTLNNLAGVT